MISNINEEYFRCKLCRIPVYIPGYRWDYGNHHGCRYYHNLQYLLCIHESESAGVWKTKSDRCNKKTDPTDRPAGRVCVAAIAIPIGLLMGTLVSKSVLLGFTCFASEENEMADVLDRIIRNGEIPLFHWWIYLLAIAVTFCTVYLSMLKPMHTAARVSEIEAMRYQAGTQKQKSRRKGYEFLNLSRLTRRNLFENKKKSLITVLSMAITGVF